MYPDTGQTPVRVLIVEDEPKLAALLRDYLSREGFAVEILDEGTKALETVRRTTPDIMLLDVMLPGKGGLDICREVRAESSLPIIMITARVEEIDRLLGLELGADDYICKPFSPREVVARVKALLRRTRNFAPDPAVPVETGSSPGTGNRTEETLPPGVVVDLDAHQAWLSGTPLDLTPAELRLLHLFFKAPGRVFSREQLLERLHDDNRIVTDRTIDTHVKNLRRKLHQVDPEGNRITSIYGVGYRFEA